MALAKRFMTKQSSVATRRWRVPAIVTLAAMATLAALTADAAAKQARPAPTTEATAPREAGEPIMAIVSIGSQRVTFYDADGWILRAPSPRWLARVAPVSPWRRRLAPPVWPSPRASQW